MNLRTRVFLGIGAAVAAIVIGASIFLLRDQFFEPPLPAGAPTMRLVSGEEYRNAIQYVFGEDIEVTANFPLPPRRDGLVTLGSTVQEMTSGDLEQFYRAATSIAAQVTGPGRRATLVPCTPRDARAPDDACAERFFSTAGRFLFRRPLTELELSRVVELARVSAASKADFYAGLSDALVGVLISPMFLYIVETSEPDPRRPERHRLESYSLASRLSLFLWNSFPDDELLNAAADGSLQTERGLARQVDRMLRSPRAEQGVRAFFADLLRFQDFANVSKDPVIYPAFTFEAGQAVHEQSLRLIVDQLLRRRADYRDLLTTNETYINSALGPLYQSSVPDGAVDGWAMIETDPERSAGLLTSMAFLANHAHPGVSSPTLRGRAIREVFLCQQIPDPPPTVNFANFEDLVGRVTARDRLTAHATDPSCTACHQLTDPIGLGLENFDGAGQFRTTENNVAIDVTGAFDGRDFSSPADIGRVLRRDPALIPCITQRTFAYGVGRNTTGEDRRWLRWLANRFASAKYRYPDLLREIALSDAFRAVSGPEQVGEQAEAANVEGDAQ